ncbi:MAG: tRNA guanosine(15) transglycosylase TgtA [Candidatus Heimdallarchaeota archaeon]|nr:tRNA guanosine(15) transglycosylase TgtA [Candidatus Heimdallarchaeota archaeon]
MFSIRKKDGLARIGIIETKHGKINTPILLPVINPNRQLISPTDMTRCGAEAFITNAYLLFRNPENHIIALEKGLHSFIGFDGPLMTDSGAFQLMEYGQVSVSNQEITQFQERIGSDIGVFLDLPTKGGRYQDFSTALTETLNRAADHIQCRSTNVPILWAGPIQGGEFLDLVESSATSMAKLPFDIHPIGSVVPLLERYEFDKVSKMILTSKRFLPIDRPIHLFGAGHPMYFAIAVYLGVDMFDSAAYILYAKKNRYITVFGTEYLEQLQYLPCSCSVCQEFSASELQKLDIQTRILMLAKHNLLVSLEEIKRIKQAIIMGRLSELVATRLRNHPSLVQIRETIFGRMTSQEIEPFTPISHPRAILIVDDLLVHQPLLQRYRSRLLDRFYRWNNQLLVTQDFQKIHSTSKYQVIQLSPLFGIIPDELRGQYPLVQNERPSMQFKEEILNYIRSFFTSFCNEFKQVIVHPSVCNIFSFLDQFSTSDIPDGKFIRNKDETKLDERHIINALLDFQFGKNAHLCLQNRDLIIDRSRKTTIIRRFSDSEDNLGTIRPSDFSIIPTPRLATLLHEYLSPPHQRVIAAPDAIPFVTQNRDLMAKFVLDVDPEIRCGEEVFVVDNSDNFLNFGRAILAAKEMLSFDRGIAVQIRR